MRFLFSIIFFTISVSALSQVTADFNVPVEVCLEEQFALENTSVNATNYEWDFCTGDFDIQPTAVLFASSTNYNTNNNISIYSDTKFDSIRYVFLPSGGAKKVYRFKTDDSLNEIFLTEELDLSGATLGRPIDISILKVGGNYLGYLIDFNTNKLYEVNFGSNIENQPVSVADLGGFSSLNQPIAVKAVKEGDNVKIMIANYNSTNLTIVTKNSAGVFNQENFNTGSSRGSDIDLLTMNGNTYGVIAFPTIGRTRLYDFGSTINSTPTLLVDYTNAAMPSPNNAKWITEGGKAKILVQSNNANIGLMEISANFSAVSQFINYGNFGLADNSVRGLSVHQNIKSEWHALVPNILTNVNKINFENPCEVSPGLSNEENPITSYSSSGNHPITLTAFNEAGNSNSITKQITVNTNSAPAGSIILDPAYCVATNISFAFESTDNITSYAWDFGDLNSSTVVSPSHQYISPGLYTVTLQIESASGCTNTYTTEVEILAGPVPEFSTAKTEYCTFESIDFLNNTGGDYGENISWNWDFNGEGSSIEKNPSFVFETAGDKIITLEANVLGCIETFQSTLSLIDGPQPAFVYDSNCIGEDIQFTNQSSGANITSYAWDFGNGETSIEENPLTNYTTAGEYEVVLTVSNASGCENSATQTIAIFEQVIDSILVSEAVENLPFISSVDWLNSFDSTQNLSFQWEINGNIQTTETAEFTLSAGDYVLELEVTTENTCVFNSSRTLRVQTSEFPTADFNLPAEICLEEQFALENTSINGDRYEWDFCTGDFGLQPTADLFASSTDFNTNNNISIYSDNKSDSIRYVFLPSGGAKKVYRFKTDDSLNEILLREELNLSGLTLVRPIDISILKVDANYLGYLIDFNTNKLYEVNFGSNIENQPVSVADLGGFSSLNQPIAVKAIKEGENIKIMIANYNSTNLTIVTKDSDGVFSHENFNTGSSRGSDIDLLSMNGNTYGVIAFPTIGRTRLYNFGSTINSTPTLLVDYANAAMPSPNNAKWIIEGGKAKIIVQSNNANIGLMEISADFTAVSNFINYGNFGLPDNSVRGLSVHQNIKSEWHALVPNILTNINKINFENPCEVSLGISNEENPITSYSSSGIHPSTLTAYHPNGTSASITKEITVTNNQAPDISFSTGTNLCITNPIQFLSSSSGDITSYNWDLGDGSSSTVENPSHTYASAGSYEVNLRVTDVNGCNNFYQQSVHVYEQPVPDFQATAQGNLCSQKPIVFENLTTLPTEAEFSWDLGDGTNSAEENPEHVYEEAGEYIITQNISMAGCVVQKTKTITVSPGPSVKFQTVNNCLGEIVKFENTSEGDFLDTYAWDFGDGTKSTQTNPSHSYDTAGVYQVQLSAFTTNGCDFTLTQEVEIQPVALVTFDSEVSCASKPTQFTESVDIDEANITDYLWDFGIAGTQSDIATEANPEYSFPAAGNYNVRLQVTTSDGCTSVGSQIITVEEVPNAEFQSSNNCIGGVREFTPEDTVNSDNHFWELQNEAGEVISSSDSVNFAFAFTEAGIYQLSYRQQNDNLCSETSFQDIIINDLPNPDFTWGDACAGKTVVFENQTDLKGNIAQSYSWFQEDEIISTDMNPALSFEEDGQYQIRLEVKTESGCRENIEKTINISSSPTADFEIEQTVGALPFTLDLRVDSITNQHYYWVLDVDTISNSVELNHTVAKTGTYLLGLIVRNEAGCTDEYYQQIKVREPSVDISLSNLSVDSDQELTEFVLNISNRGSLVPETIDLSIDLGSYSVTEQVEAPIYPERNRNYSLSLKLTEEQKRGLSKICIEAFAEAEGLTDTNTINNRICTNLEGGFKVMDIYPNPTFNKFTVPLIIPESKVMTIRMDDSNGRQVKVFNYNLEAGYNEIVMHRENVSAGIYFLRFSYQGEEKIKKIIFQ